MSFERFNTTEQHKRPSGHESEPTVETLTQPNSLGPAEGGVEFGRLLSEAETRIELGDNTVLREAALLEMKPAEIESFARESGFTNRWNNLRHKIITTSFAAAMGLVVMTSDSDTSAAFTPNPQIENLVSKSDNEKQKDINKFIERSFGLSEITPEFVDAIERIRNATISEERERSVMIFSSKDGINVTEDNIGEKSEVAHYSEERITSIESGDVDSVIDIHSHPLSNYRNLRESAKNVIMRAHNGEEVSSEAMDIAMEILATSEIEFKKQEEMILSGQLQAPSQVPSDHDIRMTLAHKNEYGKKGININSFVADAGGLWEISAREGTPFGTAIATSEKYLEEYRKNQEQLLQDYRDKKMTAEVLKKKMHEITPPEPLSASLEEELLQNLSRCGWRAKMPYSKSARKKAENSDRSVADLEHSSREQYLSTCMKKLSVLGLDLTRHYWPAK